MMFNRIKKISLPLHKVKLIYLTAQNLELRQLATSGDLEENL